MKCEERLEGIGLLACGALDGPERDELLRHLSLGCPRCLAARAESEATLAHLALSLAPVAPPPQLRQALLDRVAAVARPALVSRATAGPRPAEGRAGKWARPLVAAALAAGVTGVAMLVPASRTRRALESQIAQRDSRLQGLDARVRSLEQREREAVEAATFLQSTTTAIYRLAPTGTQPGAAARVFWDAGRRRAQLVASGLGSPGLDRTYELWLIEAGPNGRKIPAGTFDVAASGTGVLTLEIPEGPAEIALLAVTDEPAGGSLQPTGSIHLAGKLESSS